MILVLFQPGQAAVLDSFKPIIRRIAASLDKEPGAIKVVGHTDSIPIKSVRFLESPELSVERAKAVEALLSASLADKSRIQTGGQAAGVPIASNATPEGRTRNRRVEIMIPRAD